MRRHVNPLLLAVMLLATLIPLLPSRAAAQAAPVKLEVRVTDNGWNDQGAKLALNVEEGQSVELTFVWAQKSNLSDEHIFVLDGYNLESDKLSYSNQQVTMKFVADKVGSFRIKCDADCSIHDQLKNGQLNVVKKGSLGAAGGSTAGGGAASGGGDSNLPAAKVSVGAPVGATVGDTAPMEITATDSTGKPLANAKVHVQETTGFLGSDAQTVEVASGVTNKDGKANIDYVARRSGTRALKVVVDGTAASGPASIDLKMQVDPGSQIYQVTPPTSIPGVNRFFVSGVLIVIWGTMFFVALHVVAIVRAGRLEAGKVEHNG